jgi:hypothetical protein
LLRSRYRCWGSGRISVLWIQRCRKNHVFCWKISFTLATKKIFKNFLKLPFKTISVVCFTIFYKQIWAFRSESKPDQNKVYWKCYIFWFIFSFILSISFWCNQKIYW